VSPFDSWGLAVDFQEALVGGCEISPLAGSEILWAYNFFNLKHLLKLSGPATAGAGEAITVHVVDGQTGEAIAGASIGEVVGGATTPLAGSPATNAGGDATITLPAPGTVLLKATRSDSVRSNALPVCVHNANDGTCGTSLPPAPGVTPTAGATTGSPAPYRGPFALVSSVSGPQDGRTYPRRHAPRLLAGTILAHSPVTLVRISLRRAYRGRCWAYDGVRERFIHSRCGSAHQFTVSHGASFSYLLPSALAPGRYVLDVTADDSAGNTTTLARGSSRIVFHVR
jgi:hypothetical protein